MQICFFKLIVSIETFVPALGKSTGIVVLDQGLMKGYSP